MAVGYSEMSLAMRRCFSNQPLLSEPIQAIQAIIEAVQSSITKAEPWTESLTLGMASHLCCSFSQEERVVMVAVTITVTATVTATRASHEILVVRTPGTTPMPSDVHDEEHDALRAHVCVASQQIPS
jgi:hypothetical protein